MLGTRWGIVGIVQEQAQGRWLWAGNLQIGIFVEIAAKSSLCQRDPQLLRFELLSRGTIDPLSASSQTRP